MERKDRYKVLFLWKVRESLRKHLEGELEGSAAELIFLEKDQLQESIDYADEVDVLIGWKPDLDFLKKASKLKLLINPGAGVQHLKEHFSFLQEKKIVLVNGHGNAYFTAQHTIAMLLAVCNRIVPHHQWMQEGQWRLGDKEAKSIPLRNRRVGLLGYGHVNRLVHRFLEPFGCSVDVLRRSSRTGGIEKEAEPTISQQYTTENLGAFLQAIDTLVIALPATKETIGMISARELDLLGETGIVVNVGRGDIINEEDFYEALRDRQIAQAAIDVWYNYKPEADASGKKFPAEFPFHELDNVLLSPHRAASPLDDLQRWDDVIENIRRVGLGENDFLNVVDLKQGY